MTFVPLKGEDFYRNVQVGAAFYAYWKHRSKGGISDTRASEEDRNVGVEVDVFLRWRLLSDVGATLNYGVFFPGDAYPDGSDDERHYVSVGVTYGL